MILFLNARHRCAANHHSIKDKKKKNEMKKLLFVLTLTLAIPATVRMFDDPIPQCPPPLCTGPGGNHN
jgi:hypothetical protein